MSEFEGHKSWAGDVSAQSGRKERRKDGQKCCVSLRTVFALLGGIDWSDRLLCWHASFVMLYKSFMPWRLQSDTSHQNLPMMLLFAHVFLHTRVCVCVFFCVRLGVPLKVYCITPSVLFYLHSKKNTTMRIM